MAQCSRSLLLMWPSASPLPPASGVSGVSVSQFPLLLSGEAPLCVAESAAPDSENPCPDAVEKGDGGARQSGIFWGCWMGSGESECWRLEKHRRDVPGHAVLCQPDRTSCSRGWGWGCGDVFCRSLAAAWMELPGNCRVEAKREQSGSCRDPRSSISTQTLWTAGPVKAMGSLAVSPRPLPSSHPGVATGPSLVSLVVLQGDGPRRRGLAHAGLSCKVELGAVGMGRMGTQHPAGAGQEDQPQASATSRPALPQNLPQHLPRHAGARSSLAGGGNGGVWQPPRPAHPARGATQPQGCQGGGSRTHTRPFPTLRRAQRAGLGVQGGSSHSWGCAPVPGTLVRGSTGLAWGNRVGARGEMGHGGVPGVCGSTRQGAVGLCPLVAVCDSLWAVSPPGCTVCVGGGRVVVPRGCDRGMRGDGCGAV